MKCMFYQVLICFIFLPPIPSYLHTYLVRVSLYNILFSDSQSLHFFLNMRDQDSNPHKNKTQKYFSTYFNLYLLTWETVRHMAVACELTYCLYFVEHNSYFLMLRCKIFERFMKNIYVEIMPTIRTMWHHHTKCATDTCLSASFSLLFLYFILFSSRSAHSVKVIIWSTMWLSIHVTLLYVCTSEPHPVYTSSLLPTRFHFLGV